MELVPVHPPVDPPRIRVLDDIYVPCAYEPSPIYSVDSWDREVEQVDVLPLQDILLAGGPVHDHRPDDLVTLSLEPVDQLDHRRILRVARGQREEGMDGPAGAEKVGKDPVSGRVSLYAVEQQRPCVPTNSINWASYGIQ